MSKPGKSHQNRSPKDHPSRHSTPEDASFGADFIPFEAEFRTGEDIPGKRKREQLDSTGGEQRQPKLARYEDGSFTTPWLKYMGPNLPRDAGEFFNEEVKAFAKYISPTTEENSLRELIIKEIEYHSRKIWPDATAIAFGSYATGLYLPTGDIDIVLQTRYASASTRTAAQNALMKLASVLRNAGLAERRKVQVIAARVSIIKFNSVHGGISIDISLNQMTGLTAITVIKKYLDYYPAIRPLIFIVKAYLNQRGMNEVYKGGLGSYSIICMVISFLQMHPKIRLGEIDPSDNLGVLLVEFFELYGHLFNYNTIGISLNNGGSYFQKLQRGWQDMSKPWLLSIADPTDETNDVSRGSFQMLRLRQTLAGAHLILTTRLLELSEQIRSLHEGYHFRLGNVESLQTVLGKLIAMSPEAVQQRTAIREAYTGGRLQRALNLPPPAISQLPVCSEETPSLTKGLTSVIPRDVSQSLRRETHAFSDGDNDPDGSDLEAPNHSNHERDEDSRYTSNSKKAKSSARHTTNRFEPLGGQTVQFIMSDSEEDEGVDDVSDVPTSHADKRRKVEPKSPRPTLLSKASRRSYWASKARVEE